MLRKIWAKLVSLALIITAVLLVGTVWAQEFVTDGLIGFWTLDKTSIKGKAVSDVWGDNEGQISGGNPKMVKGKINEALEFDGASDVIQLPDLGHSETVTVEVWLKAYSFPQYAGLVSAPTSDPGMVHFKLRSSAAVSVDKRDNGNSLDSPPIESEEWVHALFTCDTTEDLVELYVNGELIGTDISGPTPVDLTGLMIGREKSDRYFPGVLDEVRIYNRVLNEDEVLQNYQVESNSMLVNSAGKLTIIWGDIKTTP